MIATENAFRPNGASRPQCIVAIAPKQNSKKKVSIPAEKHQGCKRRCFRQAATRPSSSEHAGGPKVNGVRAPQFAPSE